MVKTVSASTRLKQWLDGDLLLLSKGAVWAELLMELAQGTKDPRLLRKGLPVFAALCGILTLWYWNGGLLLALVLGSGSGIVVYQVLQQQPTVSWQTIQGWLQKPQAPLGLSIAAGAGILALSYSALAIWHDLKSPWLALLLLTQEMGILLALGLAVGLILTRNRDASVPAFERCVVGLLHRSELRRLVAVRQLAALATQAGLTPQEQAMAIEYLQLLARKEADPMVTAAIRESLMVLTPAQRQLSDRSTQATRVLRQSAPRKMGQKATADMLSSSS